MAAAIEISNSSGDVRVRVVEDGTASSVDLTNKVCPTGKICFSRHARWQRCG